MVKIGAGYRYIAMVSKGGAVCVSEGVVCGYVAHLQGNVDSNRGRDTSCIRNNHVPYRLIYMHPHTR